MLIDTYLFCAEGGAETLHIESTVTIERGKGVHFMDEKKKGGSPEHVPTEESRAKVADFTCAGFTQTDIAKYFNIDDKTLRKHYRDELDKAKLEMIRGLSQNAYRMALGGSEKMTEFLLRTQGRYTNYKDPEHKSGTETLLEKLIEKLSD